MPYSAPSIPSGKVLITKYKHAKLHQLIQDANTDSAEIRPVSMVPGVTARHEPDTYTKKKTKLADAFTIIHKNGEFDSYTWHTDGAKLKEAVRWGIVKTSSLTSQVISSLGQYRLIVLDRWIEGAMSNRYQVKEKLLSHYQDRFEKLQALESLVNSSCTYDDIRIAMYQYIDGMKVIQSGLSEYFNDSDFEELNKNGISDLSKQINLDIDAAMNYLASLKPDQFKSARRSTGTGSLLTFVKTQMLRNLVEMQCHNQTISYSRKMFALTRGDLSSMTVDAQHLIDTYNAPPRDAMGPDHHGNFGDTKHIDFDSTYHCASALQEKHAVLAAAFIQGKARFDDIKSMIVVGDKEYNINTVRATKWGIDGGPWHIAKRLMAWVGNVTVKLLVGIIELPVTLLIEPIFFNVKATEGFFKGLRQLATDNQFVVAREAKSFVDDPVISELVNETYRRPLSLGLRVRHLAVVLFKNTIQDMFYGVRDIYREFTVHLFDDIFNDYNEGQAQELKFATIKENCEHEIKIIKDGEKEAWDKLDIKQEDAEKLFKSVEEHHVQSATPEFIPSSGEFDDILNSAADGTDKFMSFFLHNIHAKHPFVGLIFSLTYIVSGLAVVAPSTVAALGPWYLAFSQGMGYGMSSSKMGAAISSACTQAQIASSVFEALFHGPKSWMATNAVEFEKDPFTSIVFAATAVGFGYAVVHHLNIPWLSETLREDMGTFPPSSQAFIGAKLGVAVYELLMEHSHTELGASKNEKLKLLLKEMYLRKFPDASPEVVKENVEFVMDAVSKPDAQQQLLALHQELEKRHQVNAEQKEKINEQLIKTRTDIINSGNEDQVTKDFQDKLKAHLSRVELIIYLKENQERLPYLSAKTKHQIERHLRQQFSSAKARSLMKFLHPEESASILRTTLGIIFAYPAFLIRVIVAAGSSVIQGSMQPLKRAATDFGFKILKDIARVGRAAGKFFKTGVNYFRRMAKSVGDVFANSMAARAEALLANTHHIASTTYWLSAKFDVGHEVIGEALATPVNKGIRKAESGNKFNAQRKVTGKFFMDCFARNDGASESELPSNKQGQKI